jgi:hypothetical protein
MRGVMDFRLESLVSVFFLLALCLRNKRSPRVHRHQAGGVCANEQMYMAV